MTTPQRLFAGDSIGKFLTDKLSRMKTSIASLNSVEDLDEDAPSIVANSHVEHCTLRRSEARFDLNEVADGVLVELNIPVEGTTMLLLIGPNGYGAQPTVQGNVHQRRAAWRLTDDEPAGDSLTLVNTYATAPEPDELRAWAKKQVDVVEDVLAAHNAQVDAHNRLAAKEADQLIAARRKLLVNTETLRGELGQGI